MYKDILYEGISTVEEFDKVSTEKLFRMKAYEIFLEIFSNDPSYSVRFEILSKTFKNIEYN
jgi:hypothetical protein